MSMDSQTTDEIMRKFVINECYCDRFDISDEAKQMMRSKYKVIFDPEMTPRDDPALVAVVDELRDRAGIVRENIVLSKPVVVRIPFDVHVHMSVVHGFETIHVCSSGKRPRSCDYGDDSPMKKMKH